MKHLQKGFTLVELIIVITILSILAVGLLAALDPVEQINKSRDTGIRGAMVELNGAIQRFFASQQKYPAGMCAAANVQADGSCTTASSTNTPATITSIVADLVKIGELKNTFEAATAPNYARLRLNLPANTTSTSVCFRPTSKAMKADVNTRWTLDTASGIITDASATTCNSVDAKLLDSNNCLYCVQ